MAVDGLGQTPVSSPWRIWPVRASGHQRGVSCQKSCKIPRHWKIMRSRLVGPPYEYDQQTMTFVAGIPI